MEQLTSLNYLLSTAGTAAVAMLVTQYIKPLLPGRFNVRLFVLVFCAVIQIGLAALLTPTVEALILALPNAFIAATAAMGAYESTFGKKK